MTRREEETVKDLFAFGFFGDATTVAECAEMIDKKRLRRFYVRLREIWNLHIMLLLADVEHTMRCEDGGLCIHIPQEKIAASQSERTQGKIWLSNRLTSEETPETAQSAFKRILEGYPYDK